MKKILLSLITVVVMAGVSAGATQSYFSDTETSTGNTFAAGSLNLTVNGNDGTNTVKFTVSNMRPGSQNIGTYTLNNTGTVNGYLDIENVVVTTNENSCLEPETEAGDATCDSPGVGQGELQDVVKLSKLFWDNDCNGWVGTGETTIYDGSVGAMPSSFDLDQTLNAGSSQCVTAQFNWWNTADDNKAMGDDMTLDLNFELNQNND